MAYWPEYGWKSDSTHKQVPAWLCTPEPPPLLTQLKEQTLNQLQPCVQTLACDIDYGVFFSSNYSLRMNLCLAASNRGFESLKQVSDLRSSTAPPSQSCTGVITLECWSLLSADACSEKLINMIGDKKLHIRVADVTLDTAAGNQSVDAWHGLWNTCSFAMSFQPEQQDCWEFCCPVMDWRL